MHRLLGTLSLAALVAAFALAPRPAGACAPVMMRGASVAIASEAALILYDDKTKTEHFIRRGSFETKVPYFGFLVPTPSVPEVAEAPDSLFSLLTDWTKPEVLIQTIKRPRNWNPLPGAMAMREDAVGKAPAPKSVAVIGTGRVANFEYAILKANDAAKLKDWLEQHGYSTRPDLEAWLKHYIDSDWYITAFQMAKPDDSKQAQGLDSKSVRMSFQTERPFYPYMEPASQREEGSYKPNRLLRVFYIGNQRVDGKLGDKTAWPGVARWTNKIDDARKAQLVAQLKGKDLPMPETTWLTEFEDASSPRPGTSDLFFSPSADQSTLARPPIVNTVYVEDDSLLGDPWKLAVVGASGLLMFTALGFLVYRVTRRKA